MLGFGPRRVRAVREQLATLLGRAARFRARRAASDAESRDALHRPDVATLLDVDAEYTARVARGELRRIAPRRFNPEGRVWLPILHTERGAWHLTALFSNTARAHELGHTHDWVVIFYERDGDAGQGTVVTESRGPLRGRRVVRGREPECIDLTARKARETSQE
jgi:DNA polymerase (family 10)